MNAKRPPEFLNVDLEIESSSPLGILVEKLGASVITLYSGPGRGKRHLLCLECARSPQSADAAIRSLCTAIEKLSGQGRKSWDRAKQKHFDIGYRMLPDVLMVRTILKPETIERIVALKATIAFTCYAQEEDPRWKERTVPAKPLTKTKKRPTAKAGVVET